jgi:flagellar biosynthetic protein FliS
MSVDVNRMRVESAAAYRKSSVVGAPPLKRLSALYARAARHVRVARRAIERGDPGVKGESLSRALTILTRLDAALSRQSAAPASTRLSELYSGLRARIVHASVELDPAPLEGVIRALEALRDRCRAPVN